MGTIHVMRSAIGAALMCAASSPALAATYTAFNDAGTYLWNDAPWSAGIPNGVDDGSTSSISGLLVGGGTIQIDGTSTGTTPGSLMVGWTGSANLEISGTGTLTVGDSGGEGFAIGESTGSAVVTQSGTSYVDAVAVRFVRNGAVSGTYNLNGGTLEADSISKGFGTTAILNLNGGVLRAGAPSGGLGWISPGIDINVQAGGAIFDTQDFQTVVNSALLDGGGGGGLRVYGSTTPLTGILQLGGANTYTGATHIDQGYILTAVNNALPSGTVVNFNNVGGGVSVLDISNTSQVIAGLQSVVPTAQMDIYSASGASGSIEVNVGTGETYTYRGLVGYSAGATREDFVFIKSGEGTQILAGNVEHNLGTQVNGGVLQIGDNNASGNLGESGYTIAAGAQLAFSRNLDSTSFTTQDISGAGDLVFRGQHDGYFTFFSAYSATMSHTGSTIVELDEDGANNWWQGTLWLQKDGVHSASAMMDMRSGKIYLRDSATAGQTFAGLIGATGTRITTDQGAVQIVNLNPLDGETTVFAGVIGADPENGGSTNNIAVTVGGPGTQVFAGANTYSGATTVNGGTLLINGSHLNGADYMVNSGGTLGGTGQTISNLVINDGGTLAPGASTESLQAASVTMNTGSTFAVELGGLNGGATVDGYDQLLSFGVVRIYNALLDITLVDGFNAQAGDAFFIVLNDGTEAVEGMFAGYAEGAIVGGWEVRYTADAGTSNIGFGAGNDIVLISHAASVIPAPAALPVGLAGLALITGRRNRRR